MRKETTPRIKPCPLYLTECEKSVGILQQVFGLTKVFQYLRDSTIGFYTIGTI